MRRLVCWWQTGVVGLCVLIAEPLVARTFEEAFDEATTKSACLSIKSRCETRCDGASIGNSLAIIEARKRGGPAQRAFDVRACKEDCAGMARSCATRIDDEALAVKEKQEEEKEKREQERERKLTADHLARIASRPPSFLLACGRFQVTVWDGQGCGFTYPHSSCSVTPARIEFSSGDYRFVINRVTGVLERFRYSDERESIPCQKVTPGSTKF